MFGIELGDLYFPTTGFVTLIRLWDTVYICSALMGLYSTFLLEKWIFSSTLVYFFLYKKMSAFEFLSTSIFMSPHELFR